MKISGCTFLVLLLFTACKPSTSPQLDFSSYRMENYGSGVEMAIALNAAGGFMTKGMVSSGQKNGAWVEYYADGKMIKTINNYVNGKKSGVEIILNDRGQIESLKEFKNDLLHGYQAKYRFGRATEESSYRNGQLHGPFIVYDEQGLIQRSGQYNNGKEDGMFLFFNEEGEIILRYEYKNGEKVSSEIVPKGDGK